MPPAIGSIKTRTMPLLHTAFRLDIDTAKHDYHGLVGVKLEKCIDHILPQYTSALFFGSWRFCKTYSQSFIRACVDIYYVIKGG